MRMASTTDELGKGRTNSCRVVQLREMWRLIHVLRGVTLRPFRLKR